MVLAHLPSWLASSPSLLSAVFFLFSLLFSCPSSCVRSGRRWEERDLSGQDGAAALGEGEDAGRAACSPLSRSPTQHFPVPSLLAPSPTPLVSLALFHQLKGTEPGFRILSEPQSSFWPRQVSLQAALSLEKSYCP